jgi:hypothetical protein
MRHARHPDTAALPPQPSEDDGDKHGADAEDRDRRQRAVAVEFVTAQEDGQVPQTPDDACRYGRECRLVAEQAKLEIAAPAEFLAEKHRRHDRRIDERDERDRIPGGGAECLIRAELHEPRFHRKIRHAKPKRGCAHGDENQHDNRQKPRNQIIGPTPEMKTETRIGEAFACDPFAHDKGRNGRRECAGNNRELVSSAPGLRQQQCPRSPRNAERQHQKAYDTDCRTPHAHRRGPDRFLNRAHTTVLSFYISLFSEIANECPA